MKIDIKETAITIAGIGAFAIILLCAYYYGIMIRALPLIIIGLFFASILISILFAFAPPFNKVSNNIRNVVVIVCLIISVIDTMFLLDKNQEVINGFYTPFVNGETKPQEVTELDENDNEYTETENVFTPATKEDEDKENIIDAIILELCVNSVLLPFFILKNTFKNSLFNVSSNN